MSKLGMTRLSKQRKGSLGKTKESKVIGELKGGWAK